MAVIIEYPDTMATRQLALLNMPFPDLVKYCVLSVSLLLLLLALIIFLWQIFRCCKQTNAASDTSGYSSIYIYTHRPTYMHIHVLCYRSELNMLRAMASMVTEFCPLSVYSR